MKEFKELLELWFIQYPNSQWKNNGWIISADGVEDTLHLRKLTQITGFIRYIEYGFCEGMDAEIYCSFKHAMEKDD